MKTLRLAVILLSGFSAMSLTACGEGYDVVKIRGSVPYTEERTAGPGVAYVRAHMMPEKTVVIPQEIVTPAPAPVPMETAEPIFEQKIQKK